VRFRDKHGVALGSEPSSTDGLADDFVERAKQLEAQATQERQRSKSSEVRARRVHVS
jgi:hypothetical protein